MVKNDKAVFQKLSFCGEMALNSRHVYSSVLCKPLPVPLRYALSQGICYLILKKMVIFKNLVYDAFFWY